jgi:glycosyl transferase family 2
LVPEDERIRLIEIAGPIWIGEKRNFGCERAIGEFIAHWDDDDHSAPGRLADQIGRILENGKAVTGYREMRFTDGTNSWIYRGAADFALGTSLLYRREWWQKNKFPAVQIGEDGIFTTAAAKQNQLVSAEAGDLMYATVHADNTSPRQLKGSNWRQL